MIYVVRHGETEGNVERVLRGQAFDDKLTKVGIEQAKDVAKQLAGVKFDACYCSPMSRTRQTCELITDHKIVFDERLLSLHYSDSLIGMADRGDAVNKMWAQTDSDKEGESLTDFKARIFEFFDEITKKHARQNVLVVTHASVCKMVKAYFNGTPKDNDYSNIITKNCEIIKGVKKKNG